MPRLSVVIPVYNVKNYLETAIDSILNQTVLPSEVVIVDDGSTDGSGEMLEQLYGHIPFVRIVHTENRGLGEARNEGNRHVTGDYIYYFDSDDVAVPTLVESFYHYLEQHPALDIYCFSAASFWDVVPEDPEAAKMLPQYDRQLNQTFENGISAFNILSENNTFYPNAWLYVFRRGLIVDHDLWFKPIIHEDEEFTPRLFFAAQQVISSTEVLFRRRVRMGSIMQSNRSEKNVIGYIESIHSLEGLKANAQESRVINNLANRILNNIIAIYRITKEEGVVLSPESDQRFSALLARNSTPQVKLAGRSLFALRVYKFAQRRAKQLLGS
ncbi:glycosyltransferase family 2 protein [Nissabacter sp. SGAir0207]|uniref:glycosyltransferase family 2 protein n=1 Tax=Nissabacter sp. SGAir0207 TaxID=2126321 RepID=UPI0010CD130A|nr:glycosyltransferase family 2 protein [Nissabacter sp. SGAir0207]QCR35736.1 capsular biosynthesis protein [Nissabacter sp. SGAir0207]